MNGVLKKLLKCVMVLFASTLILNPVLANEKLVGVEIGDTFNLKVVENSFDPSDLGVDFKQFSDISFKDLSLDQINVEVGNMVPDKNEVIGIEVSQLPSETTTGTIDITYWNVTETVETDFYIGTPVTTTNWTDWGNKIDIILAEMAATSDDVYTNNLERELNASYFMNHAYLSIALPDDPDNKLRIHQIMEYERDTGILGSMTINIELDTGTQLGTIKQTFKVIQTDEPITTQPPTDTGSSAKNPLTPGFELFSLTLAMPVAIGFIRRFKRK